jgi:uncharacterized repeat protein (TIGR02543 family)
MGYEFTNDTGVFITKALGETCTITYDANGGTGTVTDPNISYDVLDEITVLSGSGLSKEGYNFRFWNTAADGSGTTYNPDDTIEAHNDVTLYAIWIQGSISEYTISSTDYDYTYLNVGGTEYFLSTIASMFGSDILTVGKLASYGVSFSGIALRFPVDIPAGQTILSAKVQLYQQDTGQPTTGVKCDVYLEKTVTPAAFSSVSDYKSRVANSTTKVQWDDATLIEEAYNDTPDLTTAFNEVYSLGTPEYVVVYIDDWTGRQTSDPALYGFYGYDLGGNGYQAKLIVNYKSKSTPPVAGLRVPWRLANE